MPIATLSIRHTRPAHAALLILDAKIDSPRERLLRRTVGTWASIEAIKLLDD